MCVDIKAGMYERERRRDKGHVRSQSHHKVGAKAEDKARYNADGQDVTERSGKEVGACAVRERGSGSEGVSSEGRGSEGGVCGVGGKKAGLGMTEGRRCLCM